MSDMTKAEKTPIAGWETRRGHAIAARHAKDFGLTLAQFTGEGRRRELAHARQDAMLAVHRDTNLNLEQIALIFKRDHSTVHHGIKESEKREKDSVTAHPFMRGTDGEFHRHGAFRR